ncbi:MAG: SusC/RagA family TonB-linked outer membrane protein, partial [Bacteroidetes bacterium]
MKYYLFDTKIVGLTIFLLLTVLAFKLEARVYASTSVTAEVLKPITGTVTDDDGTPLAGVSIIVKGKKIGAITDANGAFSIDAEEGDILVFSYYGFETKEVVIGAQNTLNVSLVSDISTLDEVVVVGYGTRKKSHNTGAISQVRGTEVAAIQANRVDDALAGKLAGVLIQNQDGAPGADPKIQVRAASSITGDSEPLIVVDGYPISGNLATVNPNDIESIEVLKDAASAAIYGSRGANGVILVTTKKGKTGRASLSYNAYASTSSRYVRDVEQLKTAGEWANELETGIANGTYDVSELDPAFVNYKINAYKSAPDVVAVEDWLFRPGYSTNHDLSISGGTEDVSYFASLGYLKTQGIAITQGFERYNARMNLDANIGNRFKTGLNINGFMGDRDIVGHDMRDLLRAYSIHPIYHTTASIAFVQQLDQQAQSLGLQPFDNGYRGGDAPFNNSIYTLEPGDFAHDWHYGRSGNGIGGSGDAGPAAKLDNTDRWQKTYFANVSSYLQFDIIDGLNIKTVLGGDIRDSRDFFWRGLEFDSRARTNQTRLNTTDTKRSSVLSETTLNFAKVLGRHDISAVAGLEFQNFYIKGINLSGTNVPYGLPVNYALLDPADIAVTERNETIARRSVFGRVNYAFDNRYLLSVSVRRDGDSRFGANNRFETFPAVSVGWNVHNESFYNSELLTDLKLRFSRGSLGTTSFLGAYDALSLLNPQTTVLGNGFLIPSNVANPDLTWQTNTETNFGVNLGFLDNRFSLGVDYYTSNIEDILINQSVSEVLGTTSIALNSGDVKSSGLEFELGAHLLTRPDLSWVVNANLSTVNSEITDLGGLDELPRVIYGQSGRGPVFRNYVGGEIGEMWGLETIGLVESQFMKDPTRAIGINSSEYYVVDQNGDGVIDRTRTVEEGGDLVKIGQNTPDFYWGLSSQLRYKDFDLSFQLQGSQGGEVFNIDQIYWRSEFGGRLRSSFDDNNDGIADHNGLHYTQSRNQLDA